MKSFISTALLMGLFIFNLPMASAEIMLIAHSNTALAHISLDEVKKLYLGKLTDINGRTIQPIDQSKDSPARAEFYKKFINMSHGKLRDYWTKKIISESATPPKVVGNNRDVIQWVSSHANALGFVDVSSIDHYDSVKAFSLK